MTEMIHHLVLFLTFPIPPIFLFRLSYDKTDAILKLCRGKMTEHWVVELSRDAKKQYLKLKRNGDSRKPTLMDLTDALVLDLKHNGPVMKNWPNYSPIENRNGRFHHCHLRRGKPIGLLENR
jgi:hypothetical protein